MASLSGRVAGWVDRKFQASATSVVRRWVSKGSANPLAPLPAPGPLGYRVHVGCGGLAFPGFLNVDARLMPHIHFVSDAANLWMLPDGSAELLYASHVLEHVSFRDTATVLKEWARVLAPGGAMFVAVPDFDAIIGEYKERGAIDSIVGPLLGEQNYAENLHRAIFTRDVLAKAMEGAGLTEVRAFTPNEVVPENLKDNSSHRLSLNLRGLKSK